MNAAQLQHLRTLGRRVRSRIAFAPCKTCGGDGSIHYATGDERCEDCDGAGGRTLGTVDALVGLRNARTEMVSWGHRASMRFGWRDPACGGAAYWWKRDNEQAAHWARTYQQRFAAAIGLREATP